MFTSKSKPIVAAIRGVLLVSAIAALPSLENSNSICSETWCEQSVADVIQSNSSLSFSSTYYSLG